MSRTRRKNRHEHPRPLASRRAGLLLLLAVTTVGAFFAYTSFRNGRSDSNGSIPSPDTKPPGPRPPRVPFQDITTAAGIEFVHVNGAEGHVNGAEGHVNGAEGHVNGAEGHVSGAEGRKRLPESMGSGAAFLDYDQDGRQDLLLINGCRWSEFQRISAGALADSAGHDRTSHGGGPSTLALYRNLGDRFEDVTVASGLDLTLYGMGVACGDFDNDGWVDIFVSALGENRLLQNLGGTFVDVTHRANVSGDPGRWSTCCGWFDFDRDSDLDLFVGNYVAWDAERERRKNCRLPNGLAAYCPPSAFEGAAPYLYRNEGDGTFTEVAAQSGLHVETVSGQPQPKALGVCLVDVDGDGWMDLAVANDTVRNLLFRNRGDGSFEELGLQAGVAFDSAGIARGAMGIDSADFRNDGSLALAIGNFADEMAAVYVCRAGSWEFNDQARQTGVGAATLAPLTFGLAWLDYDLDSRLDLVLANGHLEPDIHRVDPASTYAQPAQLFWNAGRGSSPELWPVGVEQSGEELFRPVVGRALTYADIDDDGDLDLLLTCCGDRPRLFRNGRISSRNGARSESGNRTDGPHWLRFRLIGRHCNRDAIGSWIEVVVGGRTLRRQVMPTRGYLAQVELPVTFGLGDAQEVDQVRIHWADGRRQAVAGSRVDQLTTIVQDPDR